MTRMQVSRPVTTVLYAVAHLMYASPLTITATQQAPAFGRAQTARQRLAIFTWPASERRGRRLLVGTDCGNFASMPQPAISSVQGGAIASNCITRGNFGMDASSSVIPDPSLIGANRLLGNDADDKDGEDLGGIKEVANDTGRM